MAHPIDVCGSSLQLLPEKAVYLPDHRSLLVSDIHLGKSETFQQLGIPIPSQVNLTSLARLQSLCATVGPEILWVLGDLFHNRAGLVGEVITAWEDFIQQTGVQVKLIVGNHDQPLLAALQRLGIEYVSETAALDAILLSHTPTSSDQLNICGHIHPCLRIRNRLDNLRLPCFYLQRQENRLILPSFGEFTGNYEVKITPGTAAYVIVDDAIVPWEG